MEFEFKVPLDQTFDAELGLEWVAIEPEMVEATFPLRPAYVTAPGWLQTGIPAAMAETIASAGTARVVVPRGEAAMGQWNQTTVVAKAGGDTLKAVARLVSSEQDQWLWDVRITDAAGTVCAVSQVSIAVRPRNS
jgi:1,4-dihydroxy-2-naphthoyl-CoA hydrolase